MQQPRSCLVLVLAFCCQSLMAQLPDSMVQKLKKAPEDSNKVMMYWKAGAVVIYQDGQEARNYFKAGSELGKKLNYTAGTERCLSAIAYTYSLNAKYDSALVYFNLALSLAKKAGDVKRLSLAYLNRGDVLHNLSNYNAALKDCDSSIQYAEKFTGNSDALARVYGIVTYIYIDQKLYDLAEVNLDKSIHFFEKSNNRRMIAQGYSDKAEIYIAKEQPARAIPILQEAIRIGDSLSDEENLSTYYLTMADAYSKLKRYDEARKAAMKSMKICEETGNTTQLANVYAGLSYIERRSNNARLGIEYGEKAFAIFHEQSDTLRQQVAADSLAVAYQAVNNPAQAYKYLKISRQLSDSLMRKQFGQETAQLQTTFQVKEKDKEILLLNKEKELQNQRLQKSRFIMIGAGIIALLVFGGAWLLFNRNKLRQRMKELELRNRIAADLHDEVGSSLSSIHMLSQMASQKSVEGGQQELLSRMSTNAKETMDKMGDIVWMIKPGENESGSLRQRMERFAYEIGSSKNIEVSMQLNELDNLKLSMAQRKNIYLIFKEALNNAAKYSGAKKIDIGSWLENRVLRLMIKDEGKGFDHAKTRKGNGLDNMSNRAGELGGKLAIGSVPDEGTTVTLTMPL